MSDLLSVSVFHTCIWPNEWCVGDNDTARGTNDGVYLYSEAFFDLFTDGYPLVLQRHKSNPLIKKAHATNYISTVLKNNI